MKGSPLALVDIAHPSVGYIDTSQIISFRENALQG
jgi:hypothetical protein